MHAHIYSRLKATVQILPQKILTFVVSDNVLNVQNILHTRSPLI